MIVKNSTISPEIVGEGVSRKILSHDGKLMAVEIEFKKDGIGYLHTHPHEQIGYIVSGSFEVEVAGEKQILTKGDTYYIAPDVEHGVVALEDSVVYDVFTPQRQDFLKK